MCLAPPAALAQQLPQQQRARPLQAPTIAASIASAADWASTYYALKNYHVSEVNPLLRPMERTPGRMITVGAAIDAVSFSAFNMTVGKEHPKLAAAAMWGMAAFRGYLAYHNLQNTRKALRR